MDAVIEVALCKHARYNLLSCVKYLHSLNIRVQLRPSICKSEPLAAWRCKSAHNACGEYLCRSPRHAMHNLQVTSARGIGLVCCVVKLPDKWKLIISYLFPSVLPISPILVHAFELTYQTLAVRQVLFQRHPVTRKCSLWLARRYRLKVHKLLPLSLKYYGRPRRH